jgi:rhomboid protease GluP
MNPPSLPPATPGSDVVFPVDYEMLAAPNYNVDLQGKGTFTAGADGTFVFAGRGRNVVSREALQLRFTAADITNVGASGRVVWFTTGKGMSGTREKPFVFICRDDADAAAAARLLPTHVDEHFIAAKAFQEKLRQLPGARSPFASVTNIIIAVNVLVFVAMVLFLGVGLVTVTDLAPYKRYGANNGAATTGGEWWRLVTSMFLHYGIIHLGCNMWALAQTGRVLERLQGRTLYSLTYLASGVGGAFTSILIGGDKRWSAGASGAVFGVFGALLGFMLSEKQALPKLIFQPMLKSTLVFAGCNLLFGLTVPGIDNAAHLGGFLVGGLFGGLLAMPVNAAVRPQLFGKKLWTALGALLVVVAAGVAVTPRFN